MTARLRASVLACVAAGGLLVFSAARAQTRPLPGLWEETMTTKSDNAQADAAMAQMREKLAAMPPEQRKAIEQMMAAHGMGAGGAPNAFRVCLTKEQVDREFVPDANDGHCSHHAVERSGGVTKFTFTCEGRTQVSGQGVFTISDPKSFSVSSDADMVMQGKPSHMHSDLVGHYVSSDCGDVKPVTLPPPAAH